MPSDLTVVEKVAVARLQRAFGPGTVLLQARCLLCGQKPAGWNWLGEAWCWNHMKKVTGRGDAARKKAEKVAKARKRAAAKPYRQEGLDL